VQTDDAENDTPRAILGATYVVSSIMFIYQVRTCLYECTDKHVLAQSIAVCFFALTVPVSLYQSWEHLNSFVKPKLQTQIVRIIWMVPVFSGESLCSIIWVEDAVYFQAVRQIYEAIVLYSFMKVCIRLRSHMVMIISVYLQFNPVLRDSYTITIYSFCHISLYVCSTY
jgi:hypothetical protein